MTSLIFENWFIELDPKCAAENGKILLFADNCAAHPKTLASKLQFIQWGISSTEHDRDCTAYGLWNHKKF